MEIKRKFEMSVVTNRRYIIRQASASRKIACLKCGEPMLTAEQIANLFDITQRRVFQIIETGAAHFSETDAGAAMICLKSLAAILNGEAQNNQSPLND